MLFIKSGRKEKTEEELLSEFSRTGDLELLGQLYTPYMHLVYGVCLKYLKDREEAMDAVMQIYEKLITELPRHKVENFRSWLHVLTKNYCLMNLRSGKSKEKLHAEWVNEQVFFMENEPELHPIDSDTPDMEGSLKECIEKLKGEQKECISQFYFMNRCYSEIALNMNIDENKVKSYLQNAKRNLKICMDRKNV